MTEIATKMEEDDSETYTEVEDTEAEAFASTEHNDQNQLCRVCANTNDYLIPIFEGEGLEHELQMKIDKHLPIKVEESDSLPVQMCYQCATTLIAWHDMVQGCIEADKRLKALLQENAAPPDTKKEINEIIEPQGLADDESSNGFNDGDDDDSVEAVPGTSQEAHTTEVAHEEISTPNDRSESADAFREENTTDEGDTSRVAQSDIPTSELETKMGPNEIKPGKRDRRRKDNKKKNPLVRPNKINMGSKIYKKRKRRDCVCPVCGKTLKHLRVHLLSHSNEKPFACDQCGMRFKRKDHVRNHRKQVHESCTIKNKDFHLRRKNFACSICEKKFSSNSALSDHIQRHSGEKNFECTKCAKRFPVKVALINHEKRIHGLLSNETGMQKKECELCLKVLPSSISYYHHRRWHNKTFICEQCGKGFHENSLLVQHKRIHTGERPFKCSKCDKNFSLKGSLALHEKSHTGERPYPCPYCKWRCRKKSNLDAHIRTHTGEKPFVCPICSRGFAQANDMRKHTLTHNVVKPKHYIDAFILGV